MMKWLVALGAPTNLTLPCVSPADLVFSVVLLSSTSLLCMYALCKLNSKYDGRIQRVRSKKNRRITKPTQGVAIKHYRILPI